MPFIARRFIATFFAAVCAATSVSHAADVPQDRIGDTVSRTIAPSMATYRIPGMAIGIVADGRPYVFDYGVMSTETGKPVTGDTLFEIGSVSKTLTATLASYAEVRGDLLLSDPAGKYLPALQGSPFGNVRLVDLGTHTAGGLPLQVPDDIRDNDQLIRYLNTWRPAYAPGTRRTYSNVGIGTLGMIAAKTIGRDFTTLMERQLFPALGMTHSYIDVPETSMADYAQGYTKDGAPIRMTPGMLSQEAYGVRTTAADLLRFVQANMALIDPGRDVRRAILRTHTGYFQAGPMTQDLIWEQYPYPATLATLLDGNAPKMIFDATPTTGITPPRTPLQDVWINKTGSTNGFSTYVAFIPEKRPGIVMLANRNFPIEDRVRAAYRILMSIADGRQ
ncbi:class C beta-lactamase [Burkholderia sp. MR1-5-21]